MVFYNGRISAKTLEKNLKMIEVRIRRLLNSLNRNLWDYPYVFLQAKF
jgi:hypothetical protein